MFDFLGIFVFLKKKMKLCTQEIKNFENPFDWNSVLL